MRISSTTNCFYLGTTHPCATFPRTGAKRRGWQGRACVTDILRNGVGCEPYRSREAGWLFNVSLAHTIDSFDCSLLVHRSHDIVNLFQIFFHWATSLRRGWSGHDCITDALKSSRMRAIAQSRGWLVVQRAQQCIQEKGLITLS